MFARETNARTALISVLLLVTVIVTGAYVLHEKSSKETGVAPVASTVGTGNSSSRTISSSGAVLPVVSAYPGAKLYFQDTGRFSGVKSSSGMVVRNALLRFSGIPDGTRVSITSVSFSSASDKESVMFATGNGNYVVAKSGDGTVLTKPMSSSTPNIDAIPIIFTAMK